jgi:uncharacterized protein (DUF983 family)
MSLLLLAFAVRVLAQVVETVWPALVVIVVVGTIVVTLTMSVRSKYRGW